MDIPIYRFLIDENEDEVGMVGISLVENPAFQSKFVAFDKKVKPIKFVEDKKYKQVLTGLAIIPDKLIYRYDEELGEYYGYFSAEEIEKIRNKFHRQHFTSNVNTDHNDNNVVDGYLIESYILDTDERVKEASSRGVDAVLNAWMVSYKIEDKEVFEKALNGEFTGFSIESFLKVETKFSRQKNNINVKYEKMKSKFQSIKEKILNIFTELVEFSSALVPELGFFVEWGEVGETVYKILPVEDGEDVREQVGQGEYTLEDGRILSVDENSNLVEIKEVEEEEEEVEMTKAKGKYVKGEDVIEAEISYSEVDSPVFIDETPIEEVVEIEETVEVELESGTILVVGEDGLLDEIKEDGEVVIEDEVEEEMEEEDEKEEFATDIDKKLKDLIGNEAGSYYIEVTIDENGNYVWGTVSSYNSLMLSSEHTKEVRKFQREIKKLKEKLSEPVVDPVLTNQKNDDVDLSKMSKYERLMHEKGLQPLFKK